MSEKNRGGRPQIRRSEDVVEKLKSGKPFEVWIKNSNTYSCLKVGSESEFEKFTGPKIIIFEGRNDYIYNITVDLQYNS